MREQGRFAKGNVPWNKRLPIVSVCPQCGIQFNPSRKHVRCCSISCGAKHRNRIHHRPSIKVIKHCKTCSKQIELFPSQIKGGRGRFCSQLCLYKFRNNKEYREKVSASVKRLFLTDDTYRERVSEGTRKGMISKEHNEEVKLEVAKFSSQGFRCIPVGLEGFPRPDIIAFKDGKIYAVEVQLRTPRPEKYAKYESTKGFDDIIWIIKRKY